MIGLPPVAIAHARSLLPSSEVPTGILIFQPEISGGRSPGIAAVAVWSTKPNRSAFSTISIASRGNGGGLRGCMWTKLKIVMVSDSGYVKRMTGSCVDDWWRCTTGVMNCVAPAGKDSAEMTLKEPNQQTDQIRLTPVTAARRSTYCFLGNP